MAFLKLTDIGKIYASKHDVSVGIRKVNLMFEKGEFVAVTGKSGSGKTTLLNIIGGLDSYEEGEMYIEGKCTSHYSKADWDEYVAKYISFIFQDYNILESFTVLENIEFALTSIKDLKKRKSTALEIAERVGLKDRLSTKGAKLSGGEKQRTVIARAIAKGSPVILADEPTGNLDSKNAKSILALLKEISEDKLVIIVTHNYEDVKEYATRHIRIFDGGIESDEYFQNFENTNYVDDNDDNYERERNYIFRKRRKKAKVSKEERLTDIRDKFALGWKRFVSRPKQSIIISLVLFLALCGILICVSLSTKVESTKWQNVINNMEGRVIVASNGLYHTKESAEKLVEEYNAESYLFNDVYLDQKVTYYMVGKKHPENNYPIISFAEDQKVDKGRMPSAVDEVAIKVPYNYANKYNVGDKIIIVSRGYNDSIDKSQGYECTIVGIDLYVDNRQPMEFYMTREGYEILALMYKTIPKTSNLNGMLVELDEDGEAILIDQSGNSLLYNLKKVNLRIDNSLTGEKIISNRQVTDGTALYIGIDNIEHLFKDVEYDPELEFLFEGQYRASDIVIKMSPESFVKMVKDTTSKQISLIFDSDQKAYEAAKQLTNNGYSALSTQKVKAMAELSFMDKLAEFVTTTLVNMVISVAIALLSVSTLIKLMTMSRKDVAVFRTMGIKDSTVKASTFVQLFIGIVPAIVCMVAFIMFLYFAPLGIIMGFMGWDAVFLIAVSLLVSVAIIAGSYNRLLYKNKIKKGLRRANK